jgi:hypothetical protein
MLRDENNILKKELNQVIQSYGGRNSPSPQKRRGAHEQNPSEM